MKKIKITRIIWVMAVLLLSIKPLQAEPGITIVSSTVTEQSHLLATIGRLEVTLNTISLISKDGKCLATEPLNESLKIVFNSYSSEIPVINDVRQPIVSFFDDSDIVYVQGFDSSCIVSIFTLNGTLILQQTLPQGCGEVDCSAITAGYYILQAGTSVIKICKK